MKIIQTSILSESQKKSILLLWNQEFPKQLAITMEEFNTYLGISTGQNHFLLLDDVEEMIGWAYTFDREQERWFSIIINSLYQRLGLGQKLLNALKVHEIQLNGWVTDHDLYTRKNGEPYTSPLKFYLQNGFIVRPNVRYEDDKLSAVKIEWRQ
jgi:ribosomal protein S18 acetylase RimI-like enzyme